MRDINRTIAKLSIELDKFRLPQDRQGAKKVAEKIDLLKQAKAIIKEYSNDTIGQTFD